MQKFDRTALVLFVLSICQNMTGLGSDWIGFVGLYLASGWLFYRLLDWMFPSLEVMWKFLLVVMVGSAAIAGVQRPVKEYIATRHPHQDTKEDIAEAVFNKLPKSVHTKPEASGSPILNSLPPKTRPRGVPYPPCDPANKTVRPNSIPR